MSTTYWVREIRKARSRSPKQGALKRLDWLRGRAGHLDPVIANRLWQDVDAALEKIGERYAK